MKDPELMGYRTSIGQILADAGINRETIKDMLRATIDEKVERQVGTVIAEKCANYKFQEEIRRQLQYAVSGQVQSAASKININATVNLSEYSTEELVKELERRDAAHDYVRMLKEKYG